VTPIHPYLNGLLQNDPIVLRQLYTEFLPGVISHVCKNRGTVEQAKDIFQDALLICYDKAQQKDFELKGEFGGYLYGVCRFLWLRQLKKNQTTPITYIEEKEQVIDPDWNKSQIEEEKWQLFQELFNRLGADCQRVLQLFFNGERLSAIAEQMGYSNTYVKLKKYQCKERLTKWIQSDQRYQTLKTEKHFS